LILSTVEKDIDLLETPPVTLAVLIYLPPGKPTAITVIASLNWAAMCFHLPIVLLQCRLSLKSIGLRKTAFDAGCKTMKLLV
jgi:hypothetical protein